MPSPNTIPPSTPPPASAYAAASGAPLRAEPTVVPPLCWGAVIAGAVAALAVHLLVTLFGIGLGLQIVEPATDAEGGQKFSIGVGVAWSVGALLALWLGGWIAGRLVPEANRHLGGIHGFLVWSLATVVTLFALTTGAGMLAGTVARVTGKALGSAAQAVVPAAEGAGDAIAQFAKQNSNLLESYARELVPAAAGQQAPDPRALREVSWALVRFFSQDPQARSGQARDELVRAVDEHTPLDADAARARVDEMAAAYDRVQQDLKEMAGRAEAKARETAEAASGYVTHAAVWTFIAFIVGAISASCGGASGARSRRHHDVGAVAT